MVTFVWDPRRWMIARLVSRNPLTRTTDRIEIQVTAPAMSAWLLAIPVTAVMSTVVYSQEHSRPGFDAVGFGISIVAVTATTAGVIAATRRRANRLREAQWELEISNLVGDADGRANESGRPQ